MDTKITINCGINFIIVLDCGFSEEIVGYYPSDYFGGERLSKPFGKYPNAFG